jgi:hypothetical protein
LKFCTQSVMPPIRTKKKSAQKTDLRKQKTAPKAELQKKEITQFTKHLFKAEKGASISRMLTCSLLNLFFDDDFINGVPRSTGHKYFRPQADESHVCSDVQYYESIVTTVELLSHFLSSKLTIYPFQIFHYTEDEDLHLWNLPKKLNISFIRVTIIALRGSTRANNKAVCTIALKVGVYNADNAIIEILGGERLTQCINVSFWANPGSHALRRCMYWEIVVRFLRDAAENAFTEDGVYAWDSLGFKNEQMERIWVDWGVWDKSDKEWIERWGLGGRGVGG